MDDTGNKSTGQRSPQHSDRHHSPSPSDTHSAMDLDKDEAHRTTIATQNGTAKTSLENSAANSVVPDTDMVNSVVPDTDEANSQAAQASTTKSLNG